MPLWPKHGRYPAKGGANLDIAGNWKRCDSGRRVERGALQTLATRIARRLAGLDPRRGTVAFAGLPAEQASALLIGAWRAGWAVAPLRADAPEPIGRQMRHQLGDAVFIAGQGDAGAATVVHGPGEAIPLAQWLEDSCGDTSAVKRWSADETAAVLFTSGSSGHPKGVAHSQCNMLRAAKLFVDQFELNPGETLACLAPAHTASGLRSLLLPLVSAVDVAVWSNEADDLAATFESLGRIDPQVVLCGPRFVAILAAAGARARGMLPSLRLVVSTGAPIGEHDRAAAMQALGVEVLDFYGLSETGGIVLAERPGSPRPGLLPPACAGVTIGLEPLAEHARIFELVVSGPNVFLGYLDEPRFRRGVFATGDLVRRNEDGSLTLVGRRDRAFKATNTEWVYPERLQAWLCQQAQVRDAHVESMRGHAGEAACLHVTLEMEPGVDAPDLQAWVARISGELGSEYARVRLTTGVIRRTALGKIGST